MSTIETTMQEHSTVSPCNFSDNENSCLKGEYPQTSTLNSSCFIKKVYPSETELITIKNSVPCTEETCDEIFTSESNLNLHLYKTHNKQDAIEFNSPVKQFYCPNVQCIYHENEYFKNKKLLKQHYLKVHSPKTYICETCNEGFSSKAYKNMHVDYCGVTFKCNECPISYRRYESLLTHARRKDHVISEKVFFKHAKPSNKPVCGISKTENKLNIRGKALLPHPSSSMQLLIITQKQNKRCDQSIQTDYISPKLKSKFSQINRKNIGQSQTTSKREKFTSETQTAGDYFKKLGAYSMDKQKGNHYLKAQSSTQTRTVHSKSVSSNTIVDVNDIELLKTCDVKRTSSGTQTMIQSVNDISYSSLASHDIIPTEPTDLNVNNLFDKIFHNCNMETQTDFIFGDDLFNDCDYYSNMYTQTCEDMLLNSLELNNIETQTVDEMLRSVESQTTVSRNKKSQIICRDINHMETQTDMEFKRIMEVINA